MRRALVLTILVCMFCAGVSQAYLIPFNAITNNNSGDVAIGEAQLTVDVTNGTDLVTFTFRNALGSECAISEIYFDDGSLTSFNSVIENPPDVDFKQEAIPGDLPGWDTIFPNFIASQQFSMEAENPSPHRGVNPGEELGLVYNLVDGQTFEDILSELDDGTLRIGLHVIAFDSDGSESFVNDPIPEPATIALFGMGGLALLRKRKA